MRAARQGCRDIQNVGTVRRAAQVCRPYERAGQFPVVTLIRPLRGHLPPGRGGGLRAAQVCRPYERTGQFSVVTLIRPLRGHLPPERGKACGRPHGAAPMKGPGNSRWSPSSAPFGGTFPLEGGRLSGDRKGRPYGVFCTRNVCSAKSGAEVEPRNLEFLLTQGPVAREDTKTATQILRAGNFAKFSRYASPVTGSGERRL